MPTAASVNAVHRNPQPVTPLLTLTLSLIPTFALDLTVGRGGSTPEIVGCKPKVDHADHWRVTHERWYRDGTFQPLLVRMYTNTRGRGRE